MLFFEITPEAISTLFVPALFAANIAAITLSAQFFKQVDNYTYKYLTEDVDVLFGTESSRLFDDGFEKWDGTGFVEHSAEKKQILERKSILRTILLTFIFLFSELCLIVPFAVGCLFQPSPDVPFPGCVSIFMNVGFGLFICGIIMMFGLLVSKYVGMVRARVRKIGENDLIQRESEALSH
ncbi:MAG TPA: hypothetical protein O0X32_03750 [Methanocorpusculum sp.]|nr:hypothetical protein [Methanocorpusculum sp.]